jgi:outer membrane protein TolC
LNAEAIYKASVATYRQVIGVEPGKLSPGSPVDRFSPRTLPSATGLATATHPAVTSAQYNVDAALLQVKVAEGALYPTLALQGNVQQSYETPSAFAVFMLIRSRSRLVKQQSRRGEIEQPLSRRQSRSRRTNPPGQRHCWRDGRPRSPPSPLLLVGDRHPLDMRTRQPPQCG